MVVTVDIFTIKIHKLVDCDINNSVMSDRSDLESRIAHNASRLQGLDGEKDKRVKKRILQTLGKLKKELAALPSSILVDESVSQLGKPDATTESNSGKRKRDDDKVMPNKKNKGQVKLINKELATFAITKQLKLAKSKVRQALNKGLHLNVHTYTNLVNVHVRCGDLDGAALVFDTMREKDIPPTVVTYTTLLKGYCEAGALLRASFLLTSMSEAAVAPNTRTINTFLRGCVRFGCVEIGIEMLKLINPSCTDLNDEEVPGDDSTIDYLVKLLCQSLHVDRATALIMDHTSILSSKQKDVNCPIEYASMCLSLSRALCLVHGSTNGAAQQWLEKTRLALARSKSEQLLAAMKNHSGDGADEGDHRAKDAKDAKNLDLFLRHARGEMEAELDLYASASSGAGDGAWTEYCSVRVRERVAWLLRVLSMTFLFGVDGRGDAAVLFSTTVSPTAFPHTEHWCTLALEKKLGLSAAMRANGHDETSMISVMQALDVRYRQCLHTPGHQGQGQELFDLKEIFHASPTLPVHLELGSGAGEWVVAQSLASQGRANWISLERRFDRVYQTVTRWVTVGSSSTPPKNNACSPNLAIMSGEASPVLAKFPSGSVSHVFINHPEPPARLTGEGQSEGQHMLTAGLFIELRRVLCTRGQLTIVTDSQAYGESLCKSIGKINAGQTSLFLCPILHDESGQRSVQSREVFCSTPSEALTAAARSLRPRCSATEIILMRGDAGRDCGHSIEASSYFNRMWDKGQKTRRWFLFLQKIDL